MPIIPAGYTGGTTLTPTITSYELLAARIRRQLGAPLVNIEITDEQIYDNITDAIEFFTKWCGYTEEFLIFNSNIYTPGMGIQIDKLITITKEMQTSEVPNLSACFDYDLNSYRKVVDVFEFTQGEGRGSDFLFTIELALAQQSFYSFAFGNYGFDLITWETLKGFLELRRKVLALNVAYRFDARRQVLQLIPEPSPNNSYVGVVGCYVERPIKDLIKERWVQKYAKALTMIAVANVRGKYSGTTLMGGGTVNASDFLNQGLKEKDELEKELMLSYTDNQPPLFFIG